MSSKRKRDQLQKEIFDGLPPPHIYSAAGLMMGRQHGNEPNLTEELVALGHEVTLFASGDSSLRRTSRRAAPRRCASIPARYGLTSSAVAESVPGW